MENRHQGYELAQYQSLPLQAKVSLAKYRIRQWYDHYDGNVYVSFSGGKDSTVLLHLVRELYPEVPALFCDTGLEYPEIKAFVNAQDNVVTVRPKLSFRQVIEKYGYPLIGKDAAKKIHESRAISSTYKVPRDRLLGKAMWNGEKSKYNLDRWMKVAQELPVMIDDKCCGVMKKGPSHTYEKQSGNFSYVGTLAEESRARHWSWVKYGCNALYSKTPKSRPLSVWTEQDVLQYIVENDLQIASVYGDVVYKDADGLEYDARGVLSPCGKLQCSGCSRTGCVFCAFGAHLDKESRFKRLKETHPKLYKYCIDGGQWADNPKYQPEAPEYDGEWKNWNPKKIWMPSVDGLGMGKVFDMFNEIMEKELIKF